MDGEDADQQGQQGPEEEEFITDQDVLEVVPGTGDDQSLENSNG